MYLLFTVTGEVTWVTSTGLPNMGLKSITHPWWVWHVTQPVTSCDTLSKSSCNVYQLSLTSPEGGEKFDSPLCSSKQLPHTECDSACWSPLAHLQHWTWQCILKTEKPHIQLKYQLYADIGGMLQYLTVHCGPKYALTLRSCTRWRPWQLKQEGCQ